MAEAGRNDLMKMPMQLGQRFDFDDRPFLVVWEMTRACALACRHCRASAKVHRHPLELDGEEAYRFVDQVVRARPGIFILTGGDPMQRPDLYDVVAYASGQGLRVALSPSATPRFLEADLKRLKAAGCQRISLSIDGATRESHDRFRGVKGTWDMTMQALQNIRKAGIEVQVNSTMTRQNLRDFEGFVKLLDEIKPTLWSVFQLVPTGRGKVADLLNAYEMEELFVKLAHLSTQVAYDIKTTEGHHYRRVVMQQLHDAKRLQHRAPVGVNDGKGFVFVSHIGEIQPSGFLPITAGMVRQDELLEVYRTSEVFRNLRRPELLQGKCGVCEYRELCGGSRARAYALTGNYLGEEPLCAYVSPNYQPALTPDEPLPITA